MGDIRGSPIFETYAHSELLGPGRCLPLNHPTTHACTFPDTHIARMRVYTHTYTTHERSAKHLPRKAAVVSEFMRHQGNKEERPRSDGHAEEGTSGSGGERIKDPFKQTIFWQVVNSAYRWSPRQLTSILGDVHVMRRDKVGHNEQS